MMVLDSHAHCGLSLPWEKLKPLWEEGGIEGGVLFSPVEEIYNRFDGSFVDSTAYQRSREKVHQYLASLKSANIFVYWFVWNDFKVPTEDFCGIKWHRHAGEPAYRYGIPECEALIEHICQKEMPVVLEEEYYITLELVEKFNGRTTLIIPHCGNLNGGYARLKKAGLFKHPNIYVDTSLADPLQMEDFAADYGTDRILFGSDFPFGDPAAEYRKVEKVFSGEDKEKVGGRNLLRLLQKEK